MISFVIKAIKQLLLFPIIGVVVAWSVPTDLVSLNRDFILSIKKVISWKYATQPHCFVPEPSGPGGRASGRRERRRRRSSSSRRKREREGEEGGEGCCCCCYCSPDVFLACHVVDDDDQARTHTHRNRKRGRRRGESQIGRNLIKSGQCAADTRLQQTCNTPFDDTWQLALLYRITLKLCFYLDGLELPIGFAPHLTVTNVVSNQFTSVNGVSWPVMNNRKRRL